jgi:pyrroline-5-carboxylate reductase
MKNIGFIGFGSMGSMLVKGFIKSGLVSQEQIYVTRKNKAKLDDVKHSWPGVNAEQSAADVVKNAKYIFLCVRPLELKEILQEIKSYAQPEQHIISIVGSVTTSILEKMVNCKISKVLPALISEVNEGISLVYHSEKVTEEDKSYVEALLRSIGKVKLIPEKDFEFASEITSCGPGFIAGIFQEFVNASLRYDASFSEEEVSEMLLQTIYGTSKLMIEGKMNFQNVIYRVATKGGITGEGVEVMKQELPEVFDNVFIKTMDKRNVVIEKVLKEFENC